MDPFKRISIEQVKDILVSGNVTIVDIRDVHSFSQGHIPHAKSINEQNVEVFLGEADKTKPLVCYCYHGISSQSAASFFATQGFKEVYSLDGGYEGWKAVHG